jgi:GntR family transcriptional regulator, transcriptional repressor for pyruvate dehydrogenase complex
MDHRLEENPLLIEGMEPLDRSSAETGTPEREEWRSDHSPLVERVYQRLRTQIVAKELRAEQRLPGEHQLAALFDVSRPIVRDALQRLRKERLIRSRRGAGSFVLPQSGNEAADKAVAFAPVETIADIQRCYEFRLTIEPEAAFSAAVRWNAPALDAIDAAVELLRDATLAHSHREDADFAFHAAVAEATNNHYFVTSMNALKEHIRVGMKFHGVALMGPKSGLLEVFNEHFGIFEAIRTRDGARAREAMRHHLVGSRDRVFERRLLDLSL